MYVARLSDGRVFRSLYDADLKPRPK